MKQPRTCGNLHIPWYFCICQVETIFLDELELAQHVSQTIIDFINKELDESKYKNDCLKHTLSPDYPIKLEESVHKSSKSRILKAKFETLPGKALYQGTVEVREICIIFLIEFLVEKRRIHNIYASGISQIKHL